MQSVINYDAVGTWFSQGINGGFKNGMEKQNSDS